MMSNNYPPRDQASSGVFQLDRLPSSAAITSQLRLNGVSTIDFHITAKCSQACPHCWGPRRFRNPVETEQARAIIARIQELGERRIVFTGGDPLQRPDAPELVGYAKQIGLETALSTTGDLLTREMLQALAPYLDLISLPLDDWEYDGIYSTACAILTINLSGMTQVKLEFWWKEYVDENHATDGVFIRDAYGASWVKILSFNDGPSEWRQESIELDDLVAQNGLAYSDHFQIMFQFYDDDPIPNDGYAIDEVTIRPNTAPQLSWIGTGGYEQDGLHPEQGDTYTAYTYNIQYLDPDGDTPGSVEAHIKESGSEVSGSPFPMSCGSGDTRLGVTCSTVKDDFIAGGDYTYFFSATDDHGNASIPTAELNGPLVFTGYRVYLAALLWDIGLPGVPALDPISNPDGTSQYTVQWSQADRAKTYTLEEDETPTSPALQRSMWAPNPLR